MKRSRFTESQIVEILKEADAGLPANEVWRERLLAGLKFYFATVYLTGKLTDEAAFRQITRRYSCGILAIPKEVVMETDVMTVHELCDYLRVHRSTIYRLLRTDAIPAFRVGSDWRFTRSRIDEWCAEQQQKPVDFL
jgi:excisionase family DNA binding protein